MSGKLVVRTNYEPIVELLVNSVTSPETKRKYKMALRDFLEWWQANNRPQLNKAVAQRYVTHLDDQGMGSASINLRLSAIRKLAREAADNGMLDPVLAQGIQNTKGIRREGKSIGNWLDKRQAQAIIRKPDTSTLKGLRDRAIIAVLLGCGLRRQEVSRLTLDHIQQREGRWVIVDLVGKRNKKRTVPMPAWCKVAIDEWLEEAGISEGHVCLPINKGGNIPANTAKITAQAVYDAVMLYVPEGIAPHDLRRTYAVKLARKGGAELTQIQLSLGHASVKTTQDYVGEDQDLHDAPCDRLGLKLS